MIRKRPKLATALPFCSESTSPKSSHYQPKVNAQIRTNPKLANLNFALAQIHLDIFAFFALA